MSPEVKKRKLQKLMQYLKDLRKHEGSSFETFMQNHYEVERILQLLIETASDLIFHELAKQEIVPDSYRNAFLQAGQRKIIPKKLAERLALACGMRNILVHEYEDLDYRLVHESIAAALRDMTALIKSLSD